MQCRSGSHPLHSEQLCPEHVRWALIYTVRGSVPCRSSTHSLHSERLCPQHVRWALIYTVRGSVQCRSGQHEGGRQNRERSAGRHAERAEPGSGRRGQHEDPPGGSRHLRRRSRSHDRHGQPDWRDRGHPPEWNDRQACGALTLWGVAQSATALCTALQPALPAWDSVSCCGVLL